MEVTSLPLKDILTMIGVVFAIGGTLITGMIWALKKTFAVAEMVGVFREMLKKIEQINDQLKHITTMHKELDDKVQEIDTRVAMLEVRVDHNSESVRMTAQ